MYQNTKKEIKNKKKVDDDTLNKNDKSKKPVVKAMNSNIARILIVCEICYIIMHTA